MSFYFLAIAVMLISACKTTKKAVTANHQTTFDFEAHRGGRALMPENTIPAM